jgi:hypothetical protein
MSRREDMTPWRVLCPFGVQPSNHPQGHPLSLRYGDLWRDDVAVMGSSPTRGTFDLNGMALLPLIIARQLTLKTTISVKCPPHTRVEGGQVQPVLAGGS